MKSLLICPAERGEVAALSESVPLANFPVYGKTFLAHWFEHLAAKGTKQVRVLVSGSVEQIAPAVGDGSRWGLSVQVCPEQAELSAKAAWWLKHGLEPSDELVIAHHLPGMEEDIFSSYSEFFTALVAWMPKAVSGARAGLRQVQPGVWAGLRTRIARGVTLRPPVWIGEDAQIKKDVALGPDVIVEDRTIIENGAEVAGSFIGSQTYVGVATHLCRSLAMGNTLVNWKTNSVTKIHDPYLLGVLGEPAVERRVIELPELRTEAPARIVVEPETQIAEVVKVGLR